MNKKTLPILLACGVAGVMAETVEQPREKDMQNEPRIVTKQFLLVGAETPPIDFASDFEPVLNEARQRAREKLGNAASIFRRVQMVGFWQPGGVYFTGVELPVYVAPPGPIAEGVTFQPEKITADNVPEGLVVKNLPESLFAVFDEQRRGTMGGRDGFAYKWAAASPEYEPNEAFPGDFEVYKNMTDTGPDAEAEIMIPIKKREAKKPMREPDVLIVEMPPCRMMTSGPLADHDAQNKFNAVWTRLASRIADKINPRDFMYHDEEHDKMVWLFMLEDAMTGADTDGYDIITFDGGLFAVMLADSWEFSEWERVDRGLKAWLSRQEHLERDDEKSRHVLFHFAGPHSKQMKEWKYGKVRYFVPVKIKETRW